MLDKIIELFEHYADQLPLELFVFVGCFIEEALSPIPSFVVLIPAGAAAQVQGFGWWYLVALAFVGAAGRILASILLYVLADKGEDWLFGRGRRIFGVTHKQLESFGQRFNGSRRDWVMLFLLNALPVVPTSLLSLACGFIKIDFRLFVIATFFGSAVNAFIYLGIGYAGIQAADGLRNATTVLQIAAIIVAAALIGWYIYRKKKRSR